MFTKTCIVCGETFQTVRSYQKTCSPDCSKINQRNYLREYKKLKNNSTSKPKPPKPTTCAICGKTFTPAFVGEKYCSESCRNDPLAVKTRVFLTGLIHKLELKCGGV